MEKKALSTTRRIGKRPSRSALRASFFWPVAISVAIWVVGLVIWLFAPGRFDVLVSVLIATGLLIYLIWHQRRLRLTLRERVVALLLLAPAVAGISYGVKEGDAVYAITGVSLTLLLLGLQNILTTPFSYRMAWRNFQRGNLELALDLVDKAIVARPGYWESYQLRALLYLLDLQYDRAEVDARKALSLRSDAHPVYNTLGQIYMASSRYEKAAEAYTQAINLSPIEALYHYFQGLALFRLGEIREAAEALAAATRLGLPDVSFELRAYYYLGRVLEENGETEMAEQIYDEMMVFKPGLEMYKAELRGQVDFPELALLRADMRDMERRLKTAEPQ